MILASPLFDLSARRDVKLERKNDSLRRDDFFVTTGEALIHESADGAFTRPKGIAP